MWRNQPYGMPFLHPFKSIHLSHLCIIESQHMNQIITYLTFSGNCQEAMKFYQACLGGVLEFQFLKETPEGEKFPEDYKKLVVNASLKKDHMVLMGTDLRDHQVVNGNNVSILLSSKDKVQLRTQYVNLVKDGIPTHPLETTNKGDLFGGLTDKYGHQWLFHCGN